MQTLTPVAELVAQAKKLIDQSSGYLLHTFSFVPDEKLNWTPSPTAKSALRIVAHCAVSNESMAKIIRNEPVPRMPMDEMMKFMNDAETALGTREKAVEALKRSVQTVHSALDTVNEGNVNSNPNSPFGSFPMMFWMFLPGSHLNGHAYQIDYIQTIYGDLEFHFPEM